MLYVVPRLLKSFPMSSILTSSQDILAFVSGFISILYALIGAKPSESGLPQVTAIHVLPTLDTLILPSSILLGGSKIEHAMKFFGYF